MAKPGPITVNLNVLNDGTVAMVFPRPIEQFVGSAEEMTQLGTNLIKAATVALMQHGAKAAAQPDRRLTPARKM